ncbi:hypothetical protein E1B28_006727 [Marasmius oreades]|uniref:Uncharacterized protein n=1 Tax=Marasmius oreades TaxID=181124 RepID=A0A9P7UWP5_9AGAR|nr:uncharacterized protein E1B28_006727 [Marasmius oreades]KAG7096046.1 hypothetical protein E1B28_006727 [Marasmius oreades]
MSSSSATQTTTSVDTFSSSSLSSAVVTSPPTNVTSNSQTAADKTTTTTTPSSVFDTESTLSTLPLPSSISTTNDDGSTSSASSTDTTAASITTSVTSDTSPQAPPTLTSVDTTSVDTFTTTSITSQSIATDPTSVESQTTGGATPATTDTSLISGESQTTTGVAGTEPTTAATSPTTVVDTTSETFTTVTSTGDTTTTVTDTISETSTTVSEQATTTSTDGTTTDTDTRSNTGAKSESQSISTIHTVTETESGSVFDTQIVPETSTHATSAMPLQMVSSTRIAVGFTLKGISTTPPSVTETLSTSTETLTNVNTSDLGILTQNTVHVAEALTLSSVEFKTFVTTEFATSTLSDGKITIVPTLTKTMTGTVKPTYTLQPDEFERKKGPVIGGIVAACLLAVMGASIGIWLCRRRRGRVNAGRRADSIGFWDATSGRVLIPGHPSLTGDRSPNSQEWRPPLIEEVGDDEGELNARARGNIMSERTSGTGSILPVSYQDRRPTTPPLDSVEVHSLMSTGQDDDGTLEFDPSLLSSDGGTHPPNVNNCSSDLSLKGGVRTASLISLSSEPTPTASRLSHSSSRSEQSRGTIRSVNSPFADSNQEAVRNSYWGTTMRPATPQSSLSPGDTTAPKRSETVGLRMSRNAQSSITSSERVWKEIEIEDETTRTPGPVAVLAINPFETRTAPSLMSQVSLLNPPTRPRFRTTLTELIYQSRPPTLPSPTIPAGASPALTDDDSFHPEGLLADPAYVQSRCEVNASQMSLHSLLDHVDYSRPIVESSRQSSAFDGDIIFRMSGATDASAEGGVISNSAENPFRDPVQNDEDLLNDVSPVLIMLQRATNGKT